MKYLLLILLPLGALAQADTLKQQFKTLPNTPYYSISGNTLTLYDNTGTVITTKGYHAGLYNPYDQRRRNADFVLRYLQSRAASAAQYDSILNDMGALLTLYTMGDDKIIAWVQGANSSSYGDYTSNGFPSKSYFLQQWQTDLLDLLVIN